MRPGCVDCGLKHLAQAVVLFDEAELGYPVHRYLAIGHMAEAESELLGSFKLMAERIRGIRLRVIEDEFNPNLLPVMEMLMAIKQQTETKKE